MKRANAKSVRFRFQRAKNAMTVKRRMTPRTEPRRQERRQTICRPSFVRGLRPLRNTGGDPRFRRRRPKTSRPSAHLVSRWSKVVIAALRSAGDRISGGICCGVGATRPETGRDR